jgi:hypothetical protein
MPTAPLPADGDPPANPLAADRDFAPPQDDDEYAENELPERSPSGNS